MFYVNVIQQSFASIGSKNNHEMFMTNRVVLVTTTFPIILSTVHNIEIKAKLQSESVLIGLDKLLNIQRYAPINIDQQCLRYALGT